MSENVTIAVQYSVIALCSAAMLLYFASVVSRTSTRWSSVKYVMLCMVFSASCAFLDVPYILREYGLIGFRLHTAYLSEMAYSLSSLLSFYFWFKYSESMQDSWFVREKQGRALLNILVAVLSLVILSTPVTHLNFYFVDARYIRGPLNTPSTLIAVALIEFSGIKALVFSYRKENYARRWGFRMMFIYAMSIIITQLLQVFLGSILPFRSMGAALVFLIAVSRGLQENISIDALCHINNRFALEKYLDVSFSSAGNFWLIMLDIDDFKNINDTYGHQTGDTAICLTAEAILRAVPRTYFVARYGGDEFTVVCVENDPLCISCLEDNICSEMHELLKAGGFDFELNISAGYALRDESISSIPDLIAAADRNLYSRKSSKKAAASDGM